MTLWYALLSVFAVSLLSLLGAVLSPYNGKPWSKLLPIHLHYLPGYYLEPRFSNCYRKGLNCFRIAYFSGH